MVSSAAEPVPEETLDSNEGWRIAGDALRHEVVRYGGQGALVLALLGVIGYAGYWSLSEMKSLPTFLHKLARPFAPPPPQFIPIDRDAASAATKAAEEKAVAGALQKSHHHHPKNPQTVVKVSGRRPDGYAHYSDNPKGGRIIYQNGVITDYRWNK